jgi:hypothetical protein
MDNREQMARIVDEAMQHGDPRSNVYRLGAIDCLCRRTAGTEFPKRFKMGTVQADAYWAGVERGWMIWRKLEHVGVEEDFSR